MKTRDSFYYAFVLFAVALFAGYLWCWSVFYPKLEGAHDALHRANIQIAEYQLSDYHFPCEYDVHWLESCQDVGEALKQYSVVTTAALWKIKRLEEERGHDGQ